MSIRLTLIASLLSATGAMAQTAPPAPPCRTSPCTTQAAESTRSKAAADGSPRSRPSPRRAS